MSDKEIDYILWLCKRLVFKYKEDPNILKTVEEILNKNNHEIKFYQQTHRSIPVEINNAISSLKIISTNYEKSINCSRQQYDQNKINMANDSFENLDPNTLFSIKLS